MLFNAHASTLSVITYAIHNMLEAMTDVQHGLLREGSTAGMCNAPDVG